MKLLPLFALALSFVAAAPAEAQVPGQFVSDGRTACKFWWPEPIAGARKFQSFRWNGSCTRGVASGHATFELVYQFADSSVVWTGEGEAADGKLNGRAFMVSNYGVRYEGEYRDGVLNGRGFFTADNGDTKGRYEGEFRNGQPDGTGVRDEQQTIFTGGPPLTVHYQGEWKDGKQIKGLVITRMAGCSAEERYEGEMTDNKYNGRGTLKTADGKTYTGVWTMGSLNAGGREISSSDIKPVANVCRK